MDLTEIAIAKGPSTCKNKRIFRVTKKTVKANVILLVAAVICLLLFLFVGSRDHIGTDINTNENTYNVIHRGSLSLLYMEPAYIIASKILPAFQALVFAYAFISLGLKELTFVRLSKYFYVSLLLFYSDIMIRYDMGIMRQGLAIAFVILGWNYVSDEKLGKEYWITYALAIFCHYSAAASIIPILFRKRKISSGVMIGTSAVAFVLSNTSIINRLLQFIFSLLPGTIFAKYQGHMLAIDTGISIGNIRRFALLFFFCILFDKFKEDDSRIRFFINSFYIGTLIYYLFKPYTIISGRLSIYFCCTETILLPYFLSKFKKRSIRMLIMCFIALYTFYYTNMNVHSFTESWMNEPYLPYKSVLW